MRIRFAVPAGLVTAGAVCWYLLAPPTYAVPAGPAADDPACDKVVSTAPDAVLGEERDRVDGPGAAAWGEASVVLRCGVAPPPPTTNLCMNVSGIDWVLNKKREQQDTHAVLTTYGRVPAVEVTIEGTVGHYGGVLSSLNRVLDGIPQTRKCYDLGDVP